MINTLQNAAVRHATTMNLHGVTRMWPTAWRNCSASSWDDYTRTHVCCILTA